MDYSAYASLMTLVMLLVFVGIVAWAWSAKRRAAFEAAARMPLEDDDGFAATPRVQPHDKETE
jgi:cytochrome c oxidase cbb3-type subunit IV